MIRGKLFSNIPAIKIRAKTYCTLLKEFPLKKILALEIINVKIQFQQLDYLVSAFRYVLLKMDYMNYLL